VGWFDVVMEMPNLDRLPLGLLPALPSPSSLEQPLPKSLPDSPIIIIFEHCKTKKQYE
jgi:hypothetical protein